MRILDFPDLRQISDYDCGAVAVQSVLEYYGIDSREENVLKMAKTSKSDGTPVSGIIKVLKHFHLRFYQKEMDIDLLKKYIRRRIPVILLVQAWVGKKIDWHSDWHDNHFVVAIGYDHQKIIFEDPSSCNKTYLFYDELETRWHNLDLDGKKYLHYGIAVYGKKIAFNTDHIIHMD